MNFYVCDNCGFWQERFDVPTNCPVCADVRHTLPTRGFRFLTAPEALREYACVWTEAAADIFAFRNAPGIGIGTCGYVIRREAGNIAFEATGVYSDEALEFIARLGGIKYFSASHPHAYGGAWQLQQKFNPTTVINVKDLTWTNSLAVDFPFDAHLELDASATLYHTGGHFDGHTISYLSERRILFAGDALKFHLNENPIGISCHKAFNRRVPLSHAEIRKYREVIGALDFKETFTTFEFCAADTAAAARLFDRQLSGKPFFGSIPMYEGTGSVEAEA